MQKLTKKTANQIADLINTLQVAEGFIARAELKGDAESEACWRCDWHEARRDLANMGIILPGVRDAQSEHEYAQMSFDRFAMLREQQQQQQEAA